MSESKYNFYKNAFKANYNQSKKYGGAVAESTNTAVKTDTTANIDTSVVKIDSSSSDINAVATETKSEVTEKKTEVTEPIASETPKSKVEFKISLDDDLSKKPKTNIDSMFFKSIFGF